MAAPESLCHDPVPSCRRQKTVHVVSHGPTCLDGVTAAVGGGALLRRSRAGRGALRQQQRDRRRAAGAAPRRATASTSCGSPTSRGASRRPTRTCATLAAARRPHLLDRSPPHGARAREGGPRRRAVRRHACCREEFAASRLTYEYLARAARRARVAREPRFDAFAPVVAMADDNDRWLHRVPGSRELAWVVRALGPDAYEDFLALDERVTYTPRMAAARARVGAEIARSFAVAEREPRRALRRRRARRRGGVRRPSERDRRRLGQGDAGRGVRALGRRRACR